jgi:hypothetical protein
MHIRIANGKANMGPVGAAKWMKIVVENIGDGGPDGAAVVLSISMISTT